MERFGEPQRACRKRVCVQSDRLYAAMLCYAMLHVPDFPPDFSPLSEKLRRRIDWSSEMRYTLVSS